MIEAVFISDLHLHPEDDVITARFKQFIQWAARNTKKVYILGDLFHVWEGDDGLNQWSQNIAAQFSWLATQGVSLFYMHGNRDFLLGKRFFKLASVQLLTDTTVITLDDEKVLLSHGDRYCTKDKSHQWFRYLTRNALFPKLFLCIPYFIRSKLVHNIRVYSQSNRSKPLSNLDVEPEVLLSNMHKLGVHIMIHGHTHKPGLNTHTVNKQIFRRYVLSDWDDNPLILCYDKPNGFYFDLISENYDARPRT